LYSGGLELPRNQRLSAACAVFVDAYHTNRGELGTLDTDSGNIDIFVNGGGGPVVNSQPGCSVFDYPGTGIPGLAGLTGMKGRIAIKLIVHSALCNFILIQFNYSKFGLAQDIAAIRIHGGPLSTRAIMPSSLVLAMLQTLSIQHVSAVDQVAIRVAQFLFPLGKTSLQGF
jgi:hypothetical protein